MMRESRFEEQREIMELPAQGMEWFLQGLEMYVRTTRFWMRSLENINSAREARTAPQTAFRSLPDFPGFISWEKAIGNWQRWAVLPWSGIPSSALEEWARFARNWAEEYAGSGRVTFCIFYSPEG
ncbi:MAG: hypothetical protein WCY54_01405 [Syntrophales bacterium]